MAFMTGKELKKFFKDHLVPSSLYKIGGNHKNRICMKKGKNGWDVYFSEDKQKVGLLRFGDEESACRAMMNEIRKLMEVMYGVTWTAAR